MDRIKELAPKDYFEKDCPVNTSESIADSIQQLRLKLLYVIYSGVYDNLTCKEIRNLFPEFEQLCQ